MVAAFFEVLEACLIDANQLIPRYFLAIMGSGWLIAQLRYGQAEKEVVGGRWSGRIRA